MSKKTNTKATETPITDSAELEAMQQTAAKTAETEAAAEDKTEAKAEAKPEKSVVYCGPSIRGVVRQYTVFTGDIPELLAGFIKEHPIAKALIVPAERFAEVRSKVETAGTAEAILFKQIKAEI